MIQEKLDKHETTYVEDRYATQKDLRILSLELDQKLLQLKLELLLKMSSIEKVLFYKLGTMIVGCSGILFGLLSYFHKS